MVDDITQYAIFLLVLTGIVVPLGTWLARTFTGVSHTGVERVTYKILGIDSEEKMQWKRYGLVLVLANAAMMVLGYFLLRIQDLLPFDALGRSAQTPDLAFNTASSFVTNTNWQSYSGESSLSNLSFWHACVRSFVVLLSSILTGQLLRRSALGMFEWTCLLVR